jgi:TatD DNase family protein
MLIDVHSHLDHPLLRDRIGEIVTNARNSKLRHIITNGIDPQTNRICLELSKRYDIIECGLGIYPRSHLRKEVEQGYTNVNPVFNFDEEIEFIRGNKNNFIAISEVGLDFSEGENSEQIMDFERLISLAEELKKPIVVHSRKAEQKAVEVLESYNLKKIVMHCFCGRKSLVKRIMDNGWFFSIPATIVRAEHFQMIVNEVPITQLFCETDSPFLSPYKDTKTVNEPSFVVESYKKIAEIKKMDFDEVVNNIYMNWQRVFISNQESL